MSHRLTRRCSIALLLLLFAAQGAWGCSSDDESAIDLGPDAPHTQQDKGPKPADTSAPTPDTSVAKDTKATPYSHENVSVTKANQLIKSGQHTLVDLREPAELSAVGYIAGALNLPYNSGVFTSSYAKIPKTKGVVLYCNSGNRSGKAAPWLVGKGYKPVYNMLGGIIAWKAAGLPVTN